MRAVRRGKSDRVALLAGAVGERFEFLRRGIETPELRKLRRHVARQHLKLRIGMRLVRGHCPRYLVVEHVGHFRPADADHFRNPMRGKRLRVFRELPAGFLAGSQPKGGLIDRAQFSPSGVDFPQPAGRNRSCAVRS